MKSLDSYFLKLLQVTEKSALACYPFIGKGEAKAADQAAVDSMRSSFQNLDADIQIAIGEGERDEAPRLYTGEKLGTSKSPVQLDIAVDPLEGTSLCAEGKAGSLSVMAVSLRGHLLKAPDVYMNKLACGPQAQGCLDLKAPLADNILACAQALNKKPKDMVVGILDRERHQDMVAEIKKTQAQVHFVDDGDLSLALETCLSSSLDLVAGLGGAPEGVLSAAALKCLGGDFKGQLIYRNPEEEKRAQNSGIQDLHKIWSRDELVSHEVLFYATGVTSGNLLKGISKTETHWASHSLILSSQARRFIKTYIQR